MPHAIFLKNIFLITGNHDSYSAFDSSESASNSNIECLVISELTSERICHKSEKCFLHLILLKERHNCLFTSEMYYKLQVFADYKVLKA